MTAPERAVLAERLETMASKRALVAQVARLSDGARAASEAERDAADLREAARIVRGQG